MKKKVLMLAAKANMIQQFNHRNIKILQDLGYEVHVATNMVDFGSMSAEENNRFKQWMTENNVVAHQIDFERRMGSLKGNLRSIKQLWQVFRDNQFSFIHVHSPLGSILGRLVARRFKVPSIYTAHGFHFFKGGPKSGWIVFYPLEWLFSFFTDTLITINNEDYALAKKHMHAKHIVQIHSNGVNVLQALDVTDEEKKSARQALRNKYNIPENAFIISSVGELSPRKNHRVVLKAIQLITPRIRNNIYYFIAGTGDEKEELRRLAESFEFQNHLFLVGYQSNIHLLNYASNLAVLPSLREGIGIAGLDAIVDGTWLLGTQFGGVADYLVDNHNGWLIDPNDPVALKNKINDFFSVYPVVQKENLLLKFDITEVDSIIKKAYELIGGVSDEVNK